jgi:hypothetical protein
VMAKRKLIQEQRTVSTEDIATWFSYKPVSRPAPKAPKKGAFELQPRARAAKSS